MPVRLTGEVVAVLNVESDRVDAFDEGDVVALDGIASQVASAIQNARLFDEKVRALRNLEILQEITNVLNSDLELDVLLGAHRAPQRGGGAAGADGRGAAVRRRDAARALELRLPAAGGAGDGAAWPSTRACPAACS